jgi:nucleotide-binding universal stress UspA family protein
VKLVKILLPINQRGTTEACVSFAFGLAGRLGAALNASTVVIARKDRVEAVRALAAAAPFLAAAKRVKLISVAEHEDQDETPGMMADYLKQGGVSVELAALARHGRDVGEVLVEAASGEGVLLVMGAYGYWRWREYVLGGATHHVLRHSQVPVLMSH